MTDKPVIGFAGMTHLGMVMAAATAAKGFPIICYHPGELPEIPKEPGLNELISAQLRSMARETRIEELRHCNLVFVTLDTPLNNRGQPNEDPVLNLFMDIRRHLNREADVVIMSQVSPGFTRRLPWSHNQLFYQVETLRFGDSLERANSPERLIVGSTKGYGITFKPSGPSPYSKYLMSFGRVPIVTMSYESAELAKIAINIQLVAQICATNALADLAGKVGADWKDIRKALETDKRIGTYLQPGLGLGGGHIERDLHAAVAIGSKHDADYGLIEEFLTDSEIRRSWLWDTLCNHCERVFEADPPPSIAILGLAYKPGTSSTVNSPGRKLADLLNDCDVRTHDPVVTPDTNLVEVVSSADALVVATPWPEYRQLSLHQLRELMSGNVILDPYRVFDPQQAWELGFQYHTLGLSSPYSP